MKLQFQANFIYRGEYNIFLYLSPTNDSSVMSKSFMYMHIIRYGVQNPIITMNSSFKIKRIG